MAKFPGGPDVFGKPPAAGKFPWGCPGNLLGKAASPRRIAGMHLGKLAAIRQRLQAFRGIPRVDLSGKAGNFSAKAGTHQEIPREATMEADIRRWLAARSPGRFPVSRFPGRPGKFAGGVRGEWVSRAGKSPARGPPPPIPPLPSGTARKPPSLRRPYRTPRNSYCGDFHIDEFPNSSTPSL